MFFLRMEHLNEISLDISDVSDCVRSIRARVRWHGDDEKEHTAGVCEASIVNGSAALTTGKSYFDVCDADSQLFADLFMALYDFETGAFNHRAVQCLEGVPQNYFNMLIIERLVIAPRFRGYDLGLHVLRSLMLYAGMGTGICALKTYPLQFSQLPDSYGDDGIDDLDLARYTDDEQAATLKLQSHYARVGFKPLPDSGLMVCSQDFDLPELAPINFRAA